MTFIGNKNITAVSARIMSSPHDLSPELIKSDCRKITVQY